MCGINGIYHIQNLSDPESQIKRMNAASAHRGPDNSDFFLDQHVALGHNRLSIIDLQASANQPMVSADNRYVLVFNGEIYNYQSIKKQLTDYAFVTNSDSEVVLAAYIKWGSDFLRRLNGMFTLAIWDKQAQNLFIARDRLGIKPLYYFDNEKNIAFSSEIRSLMECDLVDRKLDQEALVDYLRYFTVHAPNTIVKGVKMLMPGHYMLINEEGVKQEKYWDINKNYQTKASGQNYEQIKKDVLEKLQQSVEKRLVSDVPFGAFLSGGIDSSAIVALMSEVDSKKPSTFSVTFAEEEFSEAKYARIIAEKYNTNHTEIKLDPQVFLDSLPEALDAMDHPSGDGPNSYIVSKATKDKGITMALSGLGGDELFAGYDVFKRSVSLTNKKWLFSFPIGMRKAAGGLLKAIKPSIASDKIAETINEKYLELAYFYPYTRQTLMDPTVKSLYGKSTLPQNEVKKIGQNNIGAGVVDKNVPFLSKVGYMEINTYMQNVLLRDTDQMSMAHALEVRVPFLDHELLEYVYGIPDQYKYPHAPKKLLVDALGERLPSEIVNRPKMGFTLPWEEWMKKDLKDFCEEQLEDLKKLNLLENSELDRLWNGFLNGNKRITWSRIWPIVVLAYWIKRNNVRI